MTDHNQLSNGEHNADATVLGRILAAQKVPLALSDAGKIVEFYTQALKAVPGIADCRVCLGNFATQSDLICSSDCAECELSQTTNKSNNIVVPIQPDFECKLSNQPDIQSIKLNSYQHLFGYLVIKSNDIGEFSVYQPFLENLANHVAILLENLMQQDQLRDARDELQRSIDTRTHELVTANEQLAATNEELRAAVTELAESQSQLSEAFELNQKMLSATTLGVAAYKASGECVIANQALTQMIGATQDQLRMQNFREIESWRASGMLSSAEKALATDSTVSSRIHILTTFGKETWLDCCFASFSSRGEPHLLVTAVDVSEQVASGAALSKSEEQLREQFDLARDAILVAEADTGIIIQCNRKAEELLGRTREDIIGMHQTQLHPHEMLERFTAAFTRHIETQGKDPVEALVIRKDGSLVPVEINSSLVTLADGRKALQGIFRDISDRKKTEEKLLIIMKAVESTSNAIGISDLLGHHFYQNKALSDLFEYATAEELDEAGGGPAVVKDPAVAKEMFTSILSGKPWVGELEMVTKTGRIFPAHEYADAIIDSEGNIIGVIGVVTDLTEIKHKEASLKATLDKLEATLDALPDLLFEINREGRIIDYRAPNPGILYVPPSQFLGKKIEDVLPQHVSCIISATMEMATEQSLSSKAEYFLDMPDGRNWYELSVAVKGDPASADSGYIALVRDITERKRAEDGLRESEALIRRANERYELAAGAAGLGVWDIDLTSNMLTWDDRMYALYGVSPEAFTGSVQEWIACVHPDDIDKAQAEAEAAITGKTAYASEFRVIWPNGEVRHLANLARVTCDETGKAVRVTGVNFDITEHKRAEEALLASAASLSEAQRVGRLGSWDWDAATDTITWSEEYYRIYGIDPSQSPPGYEEHLRTYTPESAARLDAAVKKSMDCGIPYEIDLELAQPTGPTRWVTARCEIKRDASGQIVGLRGTSQDITDRKRYEEEIKYRSQRFMDVVHSTGDWIWEVDADGKYTYCSERVLDVLKYTPEEIIGKTPFDLMEPSEAQRIGRVFESIARDKAPIRDLENWNIAKDGSPVCLLTNGMPMLGEHGELLGYRGSDKDITERKRAEEALRRSEERYRSIVTTTTDGIWIVDSTGVIRDVNDSYCALVGYSREELIGSHVSEHDISEDQSAVAEHNARIMQRGSDLFEARHRTKDGKYLDLEISVTYMPEDGGIFYGFIRDITLRKQMEAQLRQAQKIEALGTLAGGIAHDFNNLLFAILGNAELVDESLDPASQDHENMVSLINAGVRAKDLVQQILAFSRKSEVKYEAVDVGRILAETLHMLKRAIPSSIEIQLHIDPVYKHVMADSTEIHQVLMNLCMNSAQAMEPAPGVLKVSLREVELDTMDEPRYSILTPGSYLELVVSDSGPGISAGVLPKVFDPYFTTKEKGRGTGLGLSVVHGIIMRLGGAIWLDSQEGQGTRATVLLPAVEPQRQGESAAAVQPPKLNGLILVVDDEPDNLELMRKMLFALGCEVTCCHSPVEAVELVRERPGSYSAVITDQTMPQLSGIQLAQALRAAQYAGPVILYTGYGDTLDTSALSQSGVTQLLSKPLNKTTLAQALQHVLTQSEGQTEPAGAGQA